MRTKREKTNNVYVMFIYEDIVVNIHSFIHSEMSGAGEITVNAFSLETYSVSKVCGECNSAQPPGYNWLFVTCGCGEKRRMCEKCPAGVGPECLGIKYTRV